jgi:hypothetical protein
LERTQPASAADHRRRAVHADLLYLVRRSRATKENACEAQASVK